MTSSTVENRFQPRPNDAALPSVSSRAHGKYATWLWLFISSCSTLLSHDLLDHLLESLFLMSYWGVWENCSSPKPAYSSDQQASKDTRFWKLNASSFELGKAIASKQQSHRMTCKRRELSPVGPVPLGCTFPSIILYYISVIGPGGSYSMWPRSLRPV